MGPTLNLLLQQISIVNRILNPMRKPMTTEITKLSLIALVCSPMAFAQIHNADFEKWNGNTPIKLNKTNSISSYLKPTPYYTFQFNRNKNNQ